MITNQQAVTLKDLGLPENYYLSVNGQLVSSEKTFDVFNPATGQVIYKAPDASAEQLEDAINAAAAAFKRWSITPWGQRAELIEVFADALEKRKEQLTTLLTFEQGKPLHSQARFEVDYSISWVREIAKRQLPARVVEDTPEHTVEVHNTPLGVVGAITPWNYPVLLALWKIAPCLLTGNTMVVKPSPYTPLTSLLIGEIAQNVFPKGVLNIVSGGNHLGQIMTEHPAIAKISFTGSSATGQKVMASGASNLKRLTLELGGNDAAIVLPDADWRPLVKTLFWAAFGNSGQWCVAVKRLYVHSSIHAEFTAALVDYAKSVKVGDGMNPDTELGPVQNRMQYEKLQDLLQDTRAKGYKISVGGTVDASASGYFVPVTIVDNPPESSRIVQEEPFGPVLPVIAYDDVDEVIDRVNASPYGLGGSVWGKDRDAAVAVAKRMETGTVWVNEIHVHGVDMPFGGHKLSGLGVENGVEGLAGFTNTKTYMFKK